MSRNHYGYLGLRSPGLHPSMGQLFGFLPALFQSSLIWELTCASLIVPCRTLPPASGNAAAPERLEALKYQRIKKPKKSSKGSSKSKKRSDGSASQAQQLPNSQVLWPDEAVCLRKKKRHSRPDPFARLSDLCHRQLPEDQTAILNSVDHDDPGHATLL